jgi:hypothetical protein
MSLNIILASPLGIIVAADRRSGAFIHPNLSDPEKFKCFPSGMLHFDDARKIDFCEPPHDFVAFAYSGDGSINGHRLINNLKERLPNERWKVYDYAQAIGKLYEENPQKFKLGPENFFEGESNYIHVVGYDEGNPNALAYRVNLPFQPNPKSCSEQLKIVLISGIGDHLEKAKDIFIAEEIKKIKNKLMGFQMIGKPVPQTLQGKLKILQGRNFPLYFMDKQEMIELGEFLINFTVSEQMRQNELPTVGGGIDMLYLTVRNGVEVINFGDFKETGQGKLAETHYHYVSLVCCETETKIQIDFAKENPLGKSHIRYPFDEIFCCPKCDMKHQLIDLKRSVESLANKESVITASNP